MPDDRVHNHGIDPSCEERVVNGRLRGACMPDDKLAGAIERVREASYDSGWANEATRADLLAVCAAADQIVKLERHAAEIAAELERNPPDPNAVVRFSMSRVEYEAMRAAAARVGELEDRVADAEAKQRIDEAQCDEMTTQAGQLAATLAGIERLLRAGLTLHAGDFSGRIFVSEVGTGGWHKGIGEGLSLAAAVQAAIAELDGKGDSNGSM